MLYHTLPKMRVRNKPVSHFSIYNLFSFSLSIFPLSNLHIFNLFSTSSPFDHPVSSSSSSFSFISIFIHLAPSIHCYCLISSLPTSPSFFFPLFLQLSLSISHLISPTCQSSAFLSFLTSPSTTTTTPLLSLLESQSSSSASSLISLAPFFFLFLSFASTSYFNHSACSLSNFQSGWATAGKRTRKQCRTSETGASIPSLAENKAKLASEIPSIIQNRENMLQLVLWKRSKKEHTQLFIVSILSILVKCFGDLHKCHNTNLIRFILVCSCNTSDTAATVIKSSPDSSFIKTERRWASQF